MCTRCRLGDSQIRNNDYTKNINYAFAENSLIAGIQPARQSRLWCDNYADQQLVACAFATVLRLLLHLCQAYFLPLPRFVVDDLACPLRCTTAAFLV